MDAYNIASLPIFAFSIKLFLTNSLSSILSEIIKKLEAIYRGNKSSLDQPNSREELEGKFDDDRLSAKFKQVYYIRVEAFYFYLKKKYEAFSKRLKLQEKT